MTADAKPRHAHGQGPPEHALQLMPGAGREVTCRASRQMMMSAWSCTPTPTTDRNTREAKALPGNDWQRHPRICTQTALSSSSLRNLPIADYAFFVRLGNDVPDFAGVPGGVAVCATADFQCVRRDPGPQRRPFSSGLPTVFRCLRRDATSAA